jgi:hypothetical protein
MNQQIDRIGENQPFIPDIKTELQLNMWGTYVIYHLLSNSNTEICICTNFSGIDSDGYVHCHKLNDKLEHIGYLVLNINRIPRYFRIYGAIDYDLGILW